MGFHLGEETASTLVQPMQHGVVLRLYNGVDAHVNVVDGRRREDGSSIEDLRKQAQSQPRRFMMDATSRRART